MSAIESVALSSWDTLRQLAEAGDAPGLEAFIESIGPNEAFRALLRLSAEERERVLTTLPPEEAADLIEEIPDEHAADLIEELPAGDAASIVAEMDSDEQADLLGSMDDADAEAILAEMAPEEAAGARRLLPYPNDVAGGLMVTEYLAYPDTATVREVIDDLTERAERGTSREMYAYVLSPTQRLIGAVDLRHLVTARRDMRLADLLGRALYIEDNASLDEVDQFFQRHALAGVPVVDAHQKLLGMVHRDAVADALSERAEADFLKSQGIVGGDEIRTLPVLVRSRRRLSWLSLNIVLNIIAASVIAFYEDTLSAVIALAVFLPIVSDMSGCTGNQAVAVSIRELSLGIVKPFEVVRVWIQELKVALVNGLVLGSLIGAVAFLWKGNPFFSLVIGGALAINTLVAVSIGGTVPLLLKRFNVDPAVASGPILTTITDMCGFFLVLSLATLALPLIG